MNSHKSQIFICRSCLISYRGEQTLENHMVNCYKHKAVIPSMPIPDETDTIIFDEVKQKFQQLIPYVIYADFETALKPYSVCTPINDKSYTLSS